MFCKKCGKELDANHKFCINCGNASSFANTNQTSSKQTHPHKIPKEPLTIKKVIKVIAIVLVVAFLFILKSYNLLDKDTVENNNQAITAFDSGDSKQAITQLQKASQDAVINANKINSLKNLAYVYSTESNDDLALSTFNEALSLTSVGSFDYYLISGEIAELENKPNAAQIAYEKAYKLNPDDFQINNSLALFYMDLYDKAPQYVDYKKALSYAQKAQSHSDLLVAKKNLALAYYFNENYSQTISLLSSIDLSKEPNYAYFLGLAYARMDDSINAKIYLKQAIAGGVEVPEEVTNYINSN